MKKRLLTLIGLAVVISMLSINCFISEALAKGGGRGGGGHKGGGSYKGSHSSGGSHSRGGGSYKGSHSKGGDVHVKGYKRKDGTYVQPHMRTAPNSSKQDNYSTKGNVNPYTGKKGTKEPLGR